MTYKHNPIYILQNELVTLYHCSNFAKKYMESNVEKHNRNIIGSFNPQKLTILCNELLKQKRLTIFKDFIDLFNQKIGQGEIKYDEIRIQNPTQTSPEDQKEKWLYAMAYEAIILKEKSYDEFVKKRISPRLDKLKDHTFPCGVNEVLAKYFQNRSLKETMVSIIINASNESEVDEYESLISQWRAVLAINETSPDISYRIITGSNLFKQASQELVNVDIAGSKYPDAVVTIDEILKQEDILILH